jgi:GntR family transcriptional repressor for pyruvate dehydrogenase complex
VLNLIEARKLLEVQIAALAAERADDGDLYQMRLCLDRMRRARSRGAYLQADLDFHVTIAQATHNDVLVGLLRTLRQLIQSTLQQSPTPSEEGTRQHMHIYETIASRDPGMASQAIYEHLHETEERTRAMVDVTVRGAPDCGVRAAAVDGRLPES